MHACMYVRVYVCVYVCRGHEITRSLFSCVCTCVCVYAEAMKVLNEMYVCMCVCVCVQRLSKSSTTPILASTTKCKGLDFSNTTIS